jgi:recombination protein RecT
MSQTQTRPQVMMPTMAPEEQRAVAKATGREAGGAKVAAFFEANKGKLGQMLPQHMTADRFLRVTMNALRTTPKLMDCTVESLFAASLACAQLGLEPNTPLGHVYLIPFGNKRKGITEVQVIIGYQGFVKLARQSGEMQTIAAQPVFENDEYGFDYMNPEQSFHRPYMKGNRGEVIGAWALARFKDGGMAFEFMPRSDIDRIRDGSQGYRSAMRFAKPGEKPNTPWATSYDQMAAKTAIRRLAKRLPLSIEMATAISMDERDDRRASQGMDRAMRQALDAGAFDLSVIAAQVEEEDERADEEPPPRAPDPVEDRSREEVEMAPQPAEEPRPRQSRRQAAEAPKQDTQRDDDGPQPSPGGLDFGG